jgi:amino acid transporter
VYANGNKEVFEADNNIPSNLPSDRNYDQNNTTSRNSQNARSNNYEQSSASHKLNAFALISFIMSVAPYPFILIIAALLGLGSLISHSNAFSKVFGKPHLSAFLILPVVLVLAALLLSLLAIYQIKNSGDETKKGLKLAYIALVLSILLLILLLLFIF